MNSTRDRKTQKYETGDFEKSESCEHSVDHIFKGTSFFDMRSFFDTSSSIALTYTIIRFNSQANAGTVDVLQGAPFCVTYASALHRSSELALYRVVSEWRILARSGRRRRKRRRRPSLARIRNILRTTAVVYILHLLRTQTW